LFGFSEEDECPAASRGGQADHTPTDEQLST